MIQILIKACDLRQKLPLSYSWTDKALMQVLNTCTPNALLEVYIGTQFVKIIHAEDSVYIPIRIHSKFVSAIMFDEKWLVR